MTAASMGPSQEEAEEEMNKYMIIHPDGRKEYMRLETSVWNLIKDNFPKGTVVMKCIPIDANAAANRKFGKQVA